MRSQLSLNLALLSDMVYLGGILGLFTLVCHVLEFHANVVGQDVLLYVYLSVVSRMLRQLVLGEVDLDPFLVADFETSVHYI